MSSEENVQSDTKGPIQRTAPPKQPPAGNPPLKKKVPPPSKPPPTSAPSPSSAVATFRAKSNVPPPSTPPPKAKTADAVSKWRSMSTNDDQKTSEEQRQSYDEKEEEKKDQGEPQSKRSEKLAVSAAQSDKLEVDSSSIKETPTSDKKRDKRSKQGRERDEDEEKHAFNSAEQEENSNGRKSKARDKRSTGATNVFDGEDAEVKEDEDTEKRVLSRKNRKNVEVKESEVNGVEQNRRKDKNKSGAHDEDVDEVSRKDKKKNDCQEDERELRREKKKIQEDERNAKKAGKRADAVNEEGDTSLKKDKKKSESKEDNDGDVLAKKERRKSLSQGENTEVVNRKEKKRQESCDDESELIKKDKKKGDLRDEEGDVPTRKEKKKSECKDEIEQFAGKKDKKKNESKPTDDDEQLNVSSKKEKKKTDIREDRAENTTKKERRKSEVREDPGGVELAPKKPQKKNEQDEVGEGSNKKLNKNRSAEDEGESPIKSKTKGKKSSKKRPPVPSQNDLMVEDLDAVIELESTENEEKDEVHSASLANQKDDPSKSASSRENSAKSLASSKDESKQHAPQQKADQGAQAKDKEHGVELELKIGHTADDRERKERIERFERLERLERLERFESADKEKEVIAAEKGATAKKPQRKDGSNDESNGDATSVKKKKNVELFDPRCVPYVPKDLMQFVISPFAVGRGHVMRCFIERNESGQNKIAPIYTLMLEINSSSGRPIIFARKMPANRITTHYVLSLNKDDLFRERRIRSDQYIGKLRSNAGYMEYILYDGGENPENIITNNSDSDGEKAKNIADHPALSRALRCELALIVFSKSKKEGARKMEAVIPSLNATKTAYTEWKPLKQSDSIAAHFADVRSMGGQNVLSHDRMICFHKRQTKYDPLSSCIVDFKSRATCVSVKNFQLVHSPPVDNTLRMMYNQYHKDFVYQDDGTVSLPPEHVMLQMGKVGKDCFNMDFQYPLSMVQAFAICLSRFDTKVR